MIGTTLSHYDITAELGRGGMGIVYRATDTKLNREVALKILPAAALSSQDDRARFFREAQSAAQLHHPNIATVFEIDEAVPEGGDVAEPRPFIAMELIEGESLAEAIKSGPFALEEALRIAGEIAEALQLAHEKEIVHRDIKAANVMLTTKRHAKVLDFGLAKTNHSTMLTRMGSTLGTVAYMSPEQARGEEVDHRADVWALGCVLYEMIVGQHPFGGDYEQAVVYSILNEAPQPLTAMRTGVPMSLDWIIGKCLAKSADERYQSMSELLVDLRNVDLASAGYSRVSTVSAAHAPVAQQASTERKTIVIPPWIVAVGVVIGLGIGWILFASSDSADSSQVVRLSYDRVPDFTVTNLTNRALSITEDGSRVIVSSSGQLYSGRTDLFTAAHPIFENVTLDPHTSVTEPGGNRVGFIEEVNGEFFVMGEDGGSPAKLSGTFEGAFGLSWGHDGYIYGGFGTTGLWRIPVSGLPEERLEVSDVSSATWFATPIRLPEDDWILYVKAFPASGWNEALLVAYNLATKEERLIIAGATDPKFIKPDMLIFNRAGTLYAARLNPSDPREIVNPTPVMRDPIWSMAAVSQYDVTHNGHLVYLSLPDTSQGWTLAYHTSDGNGGIEALDVPRHVYYSPTVSPDGNRIAVDYYNLQTGTRDLDILDLRTMRATPLYSGKEVFTPVWSPDGREVAFTSGVDSLINASVLVRPIDLSEPARLLYASEDWSGPDSWSPDGKKMIISQLKNAERGGRDLIILDLESGATEPFRDTPNDEEDGRFSPDGDWIAYTSNDLGSYQIWVAPFDDSGSKFLVSADGGMKARWTPDGRGIVYINNDKFYRVDVQLTNPPVIGSPTEIVDGHYFFHYNSGAMGEYDIMPDGRLLMFDRDTYESMTGEIRVVLNWGTEVDTMLPERE